MKYYNTPECCFEGVVEDGTAYKFGSYTKEESDERYASKETEERVETLEQQLENKVDKADFDGFKQKAESKNAEINEKITDLQSITDRKIAEIENSKADKAQTDAEIKDIKNRLSSLERKDIRINSFTVNPQTVEIGKTVNVTAAWNISKEADSMTINGEAVSGTSRVYPDISATTKYTFEVADDKSSDSKAATVTFSNVIYYGYAPNTSDVSNLQKVLSENKSRTFTVDAADGEYIIYAIPERLGSVKFFSGGFEGGFEDAVKQEITNSSGYTETYDVYRSSQRSLGKTTIEVKG